jgi:hypothetical protein
MFFRVADSRPWGMFVLTLFATLALVTLGVKWWRGW